MYSSTFFVTLAYDKKWKREKNVVALFSLHFFLASFFVGVSFARAHFYDNLYLCDVQRRQRKKKNDKKDLKSEKKVQERQKNEKKKEKWKRPNDFNEIMAH